MNPPRPRRSTGSGRPGPSRTGSGRPAAGSSRPSPSAQGGTGRGTERRSDQAPRRAGSGGADRDRRSGRSGQSRDAGRSAARSGAEAGVGGAQVEGRQAVVELLLAGTRPVRQVFLTDTAARSPAGEQIADLAEAAGVTVRLVGREQLDAMALTEAPQGVVAVAAPVVEHELDDLLAGHDGRAPFLVVLDGVTDPHNLGAVMRSAVCAGATGLVLGRHRSAHLTPSAVKAAAGAVEHLPVAVVAGIPAALAALTAAGVWTVGLDAGAGRPVWDLEVADQAVALVLGAEGSGLSPLARKRCDLLASIPMAGPLDSLNVAAAATLALFEIARRRV